MVAPLQKVIICEADILVSLKPLIIRLLRHPSCGQIGLQKSGLMIGPFCSHDPNSWL